jgi:murein DD-endopeptidase MepM/ murein hydrolase activator NlpD
MYEMGQTTYLDMLLHSKSLTEFLSNYYMISEIAKVDQDLIESFSETKAKVEKLAKTLSTNKDILNQSKEALEKAKIVLQNNLVIQNSKLSSLTEEERAMHEQIAEYEEELSKIESEIKLLSLACVGAEYVGGVMAWPVPGYTRITSTFGMRTHPITGIYKLHTGVDIGAPAGTNFIAANDGIVVKADYNTAYGNMVILDHGGGVQTLYAHGTDILVEVGDVVTQGTPVLTVGSTGYSTGAHAHFEVRINGEYVEPLDYITSYSITKMEDIEQTDETSDETTNENDSNTNETEESNE